MNERLKAARKALNLSQAEFGKRIGIQNTAISKLENGENSLTDQTVLAVCREFGINEAWLRTGEGEMFVVTENALIRQLSEQYELNTLDRKIVEVYISLPKAHRDVLQGFALKLADAAHAARLDMEAAEEIGRDVPDEETEYRAEWNKGLTEEEALQLVKDRYAAAKKGDAESTTSGKAGTA